MSVSSADSGSQTATIDTEHTLATETTAGVYCLVVDTANMVAGDVVILKLYTKYASGGTSRVAFQVLYSDIQADPIKYSPPVPIDTEIKATLEQTDGTGRAFPWNLLLVG